ncbi:MAG: FAD binding domain-containing protein [Bacteriovorax sp.]|nr:FAD binding domain-containing protein [Bacteriovorax sp.]
MENRQTIITTINDQRYEIEGEKAFMSLGTFLRQEVNLTGTKIVCAEGDCGACTVLLASEIGDDGKLIFKSVNSCILPLYLIDGAQVITVEGIRISDTELHPVQQSMVDCQGAQCGYCTPGFICAMAGMAEKYKNENKEITEKKAKNFLTGNLCRCTGYKPILEAAINLDLSKIQSLKDRYHNPAWLLEMKKIKSMPVNMKFSQQKIKRNIFLPVSVEQAVKAKAEDADLRLIGGSTDIGVVVNKGRLNTPKTMALYHIDELRIISHDQQHIRVGATATLSEFEDYIEGFIPEMKKILHIFASPQIKNQATLVGNVVNGSPIADTIPYLMVSDSRVLLQSVNGVREVLMSEFYLGYKNLNMATNEIVVSVKIPRLQNQEHLRLYKVSMRKDLDISAVTFAGIIELDQKNKIKKAHFCLGGVAATVIRLKDIELKMIGADFSKLTFEDIAKTLPQYISPLSDLRASKEYRMKVAQNFFLKFHNEISKGVVS